MRKKYIPYLAVELVVALPFGCATTKKYEALLNSWVGHTESELVARWGVPDGSYSNGANKLLIYQYRSTGVLDFNPQDQFGAVAINHQCKTVFTISSGVITTWQYQGNACKTDVRVDKTDKNAEVKNITEVKKNGVIKNYWHGDVLKERLTYKDGKLDGSFERFYEDGKSWKKGNYKNGKKDGAWYTHDSNGKLLRKEAFKDGELDGAVIPPFITAFRSRGHAAFANF